MPMGHLMAQRNEYRVRATESHEIRLFFVPERKNICLRLWERARGRGFWQSTRTALFVDVENVDDLIEALTSLRDSLPNHTPEPEDAKTT